MAKQILFSELAQLTATLIARPEVLGELDELDVHERFVADIASVVADYCGGVVNGVNDADAPSPHLVFQNESGSGQVNEHGVTISVSPDENLPSLQRNVWSLFDPQGWCDEPADYDDEAPAMSASDKDEAVGAIAGVLSVLAGHNPLSPALSNADAKEGCGC